MVKGVSFALGSSGKASANKFGRMVYMEIGEVSVACVRVATGAPETP
jgi:hypothetical protein